LFGRRFPVPVVVVEAAAALGFVCSALRLAIFEKMSVSVRGRWCVFYFCLGRGGGISVGCWGSVRGHTDIYIYIYIYIHAIRNCEDHPSSSSG
jgi:hypothetical protein